MIKYHDEYHDALKNNKQIPPVPEYVGKCILLIAKKIATRKNFCSYSYLDEMISDSIENCILYLHNFDPNKSTNPFSYITKIIIFAFIRRITQEKKMKYVNCRFAEKMIMENQMIMEISKPQEVYDNIHEFMNEYETKNNIERYSIKKKAKNTTTKSNNLKEELEFWI